MVAPQTSVVGKIGAQKKKETGEKFGGIFSKKISQVAKISKNTKMMKDKKEPEKWQLVAKKKVARNIIKNNADKNIHSGLYSAKATNKVDIYKKNSRTFRCGKKKKNSPFSMKDKVNKDRILANHLWKKENEKMWKSFEQMRKEFKEADEIQKENKEIEKRAKKNFWKKLFSFKKRGNAKEGKPNLSEEVIFKILKKHEEHFLRVQQEIMSLKYLVDKRYELDSLELNDLRDQIPVKIRPLKEDNQPAAGGYNKQGFFKSISKSKASLKKRSKNKEKAVLKYECKATGDNKQFIFSTEDKTMTTDNKIDAVEASRMDLEISEIYDFQEGESLEYYLLNIVKKVDDVHKFF